MNVLISSFFSLFFLVACRHSGGSDNQILEKNISTDKKIIKDQIAKQEQGIDEFLKRLQLAVSNNDTLKIKNSISFPFPYKSMGELVDVFNDYNELTDEGIFKMGILHVTHVSDCDYKEENTMYYCLTYFDEHIDITFFAIKRKGDYKIVRMETPN